MRDIAEDWRNLHAQLDSRLAEINLLRTELQQARELLRRYVSALDESAADYPEKDDVVVMLDYAEADRDVRAWLAKGA